MVIDLKDISDLFNTHYSKPWPAGLGGVEIKGIDLVMLDADTVGIVDYFLGRRHNLGRLNEKNRMILLQLQKEAAVVCQEIPEFGKEYFSEIQLLIEWTLRYHEGKTIENIGPNTL
jgi:hypothetical protein